MTTNESQINEIEILIEMGFFRDEVISALLKSKNSIHGALNLLTSKNKQIHNNKQIKAHLKKMKIIF